MKGTLGEIRIFAGDFEPRGWAFCRGQSLLIKQNTALYNVIGKSYGGDGKTFFLLPDFRAKAAVGAGQAPGLSKYDLGQKAGAEQVALKEGQLPAHTHTVNLQPGGAGTTKATLYGATQNGDSFDPGGSFLAEDTNTGAAFYADPGLEPSDLVNLNEGSIEITGVTGPRLGTLTLSPIGFGGNHNNLQPSFVLNFIICIDGDPPPRP